MLVRLDGNTFHRKWRVPLPAMGMGPAVIEDRFAYLTGGGFIGKADLANGRFLWKHSTWEGSTVTFLSYKTPEIHDETVTFSETDELLQPRTVTLDKRTGRVVVPPRYRNICKTASPTVLPGRWHPALPY